MASTCTDGMKNGSETDTDCGGPCPFKCGTSSLCKVNADCKSLSCTGGKCAAATCSDTLKNGDETDTDCGGSCVPCIEGLICLVGTDCETGVCSASVCAPPSCTDQVKNGMESDTDCGVSCAAFSCPDGLVCISGADCQSQICTRGVCAVPTCLDGKKNGGESDTDCGGKDCPKCSDGLACTVSSDCVTGICNGGQCTSVSCGDNAQDGTETDIDCGGGACSKCADTRSCIVAADCANSTCLGDSCYPAGSNTVSSAGSCSMAGGTMVNSHCYFVLNGSGYSWAQAQSACLSAGAHLAAYENQVEAVAVFSALGLMATSSNYWLGLYCASTECTKKNNWLWLGATPLVYDDWAASAPAGARCGLQQHQGVYQDIPCTQHNSAVCEIDTPK
jgi:hypothetical protein